jgi:hypothetical protein
MNKQLDKILERTGRQGRKRYDTRSDLTSAGLIEGGPQSAYGGLPDPQTLF